MTPLAIYLERNYIKVTALARAAGVPPTNLYKYTNGGRDFRNMNVDAFLSIAHALGMTGDQLYSELKAIETGA